jgi:single-strand DNA-binding protein
MATSTIAVDRRFKRDGQPDADFFTIITFGKTAEFLGKYFSKGKEILIDGSVQNRSWEDDNGNKHYVTEVIVDNVEFCGKKDDKAKGSSVSKSQKSIGMDVELSDTDDDLPF